MPIQVGLAGFGISAQVFHAPFLAQMPEYNLHTVWERSGPKAPEIYPGIRSVQGPKDLFENKDLDLIVITTPNDTHVEFAQRALNAGKNVVLEKPFTIHSEDAQKLEELANEKGKILSPYQNRRYAGDFRTIRQIIADGPLGRIHEFEAHYDRYRPEPKPNAWREEPGPGNGIFYDLGPHLIDQALCLFGMPESIYADLRKERPHARAVDYFDVQLYYPGLKVILKGGMLVREPGPRYMVHGFEGSFIKYGEDPQEALLRAGEKPGGPEWGMEPPDQYGTLRTNELQIYPTLPGNYGIYYQNLYETLKKGAPLKETPAHGYNTVRIIELAEASNKAKARIAATQLKDVGY